MRHIKEFNSFDKVDESLKTWFKEKAAKIINLALKGKGKKIVYDKKADEKLEESDKIVKTLISKIKNMSLTQIEKEIKILIIPKDRGGRPEDLRKVKIDGVTLEISNKVYDSLNSLISRKKEEEDDATERHEINALMDKIGGIGKQPSVYKYSKKIS